MDPAERTLWTYESIAEEYHEATRDHGDLLPLVERLLDRLPDEPRVLDAGSGPGRDAKRLRERDARVVALDYSGAQLRVAADHAPTASLVRGDMRVLPLSSTSVDGIWAAASLLHVPRGDLTGTLADFRRVLRPGGTVFVTTKRGDREEVTRAYGTDTGRYVVRHEPGPFAERLRAAGFRVDELDGADEWFHAFARRPSGS